MSGMWTSTPSDVRVHLAGWAPWTLPSGRRIEVTRLPLFDSTNGVFARLTYRQAAAKAASLGGRLLVGEEVEDIWRRGFRTRPVTLPPTNEMMSLEWARKHDAGVLPQLLTWDRSTPVANVGKDYLAGADAGKQRFFGWFVNGKPIQPDGSGGHDADYSDYSQMTRVARDIVGKPGSFPPIGDGGTKPGPQPDDVQGDDDDDAPSFGGTLLRLGVLAAAGYALYQVAVRR